MINFVQALVICTGFLVALSGAESPHPADADLWTQREHADLVRQTMRDVRAQVHEDDRSLLETIQNAWLLNLSGRNSNETVTLLEKSVAERQPRNPTVALLAAQSLLALGRTPKPAAPLIANVGATQIGGLRVWAAILEADQYRIQRSWVAGRAALDRAVAWQAALSPAEPAWLERIARVRTRLETDEDAVVHGAGFVLYRAALREHLAQRWESALSAWDRLLDQAQRNAKRLEQPLNGGDDPALAEQPIHPVYRGQAALLRCLALWRLGRAESTRQSLEEVIREDTPWRGEALRWLGEWHLIERVDIKEAIKAFDQALAWLETAQSAPVPVQWLAPEPSRARLQPPDRLRLQDDWGNLSWTTWADGQILYAATAPWYIDGQRLQAQTRRGFCHFLEGNRERALADLDIIRQADPDDSAAHDLGSISTLGRLKAGFRNGRLFARDFELAAFPTGEHRTRLWIAEFWHEQERWPEAEAAYQDMTRRLGTRLSRVEKAWLLVMAETMRSMQESSSARTADERRATAEALMVSCKGTPAISRARRLLVDLLAVSDAERRVSLMLEDAAEWKGTDQGGRALTTAYLLLKESDPRRALRLMDEAERLYPDSNWASNAQSWRQFVFTEHPELQP